MGLGFVPFAIPEITGTIISLSCFPKLSKESSHSVYKNSYKIHEVETFPVSVNSNNSLSVRVEALFIINCDTSQSGRQHLVASFIKHLRLL